MRHAVTPDHIDRAITRLRCAIVENMADKGDGAFVGTHEALGAITEEYFELVGAIRSNDAAAVDRESLDIAVACIFQAASRISIG